MLVDIPLCMGDTFADWLQAGGLILGVDGLREDTARYVVELLDVCIAIPCSELLLLMTLNDPGMVPCFFSLPGSRLCLDLPIFASKSPTPQYP